MSGRQREDIERVWVLLRQGFWAARVRAGGQEVEGANYMVTARPRRSPAPLPTPSYIIHTPASNTQVIWDYLVVMMWQEREITPTYHGGIIGHGSKNKMKIDIMAHGHILMSQ